MGNFKLLAFVLIICLVEGALWRALPQEKVDHTNKRSLSDYEHYTQAFNGTKFEVDLAEMYTRLNAVQNGKRSEYYFLPIPLPNGETLEMRTILNNLLENIEIQGMVTVNLETTTGEPVEILYGESLITVYGGSADISQNGFHAVLLTSNGPLYVEPTEHTDVCVSYFTKEQRMEVDFSCGHVDELQGLEEAHKRAISEVKRTPNNGGTKKTFRLAISVSAEYTTYFGGVSQALSSIASTINRIAPIYLRELAVDFTLVSNNVNLIYTNAATDPFTNGDPSAMLGQNIAPTNSIIGAANYDIGHAFGTRTSGWSGVAYVGAVCVDSIKAGAASTGSTPTGSIFDGILVHEMGHQFGSSHTMSGTSGNCRNTTSSSWTVEPGSGVTIMSYSGSCGVDNLPSIGEWFHHASLDSITTYLNSRPTCGVSTSTGNAVPVIANFPVSATIPANTPFFLQGSATDADADSLVYSWEQSDRALPAIQVALSVPDAGNRHAIIRSLEPSASGTRYIRGNIAGEKLPQTNRYLTFQLTVRDLKGAYASRSVLINSTTSVPPFTITSPAAGTTIAGSVTVNWNDNGLSALCPQLKIYFNNGGNDYWAGLYWTNAKTATISTPEGIYGTTNIRIEGATSPFFQEVAVVIETLWCPANFVPVDFEDSSLRSFTQTSNTSSANTFRISTARAVSGTRSLNCPDTGSVSGGTILISPTYQIPDNQATDTKSYNFEFMMLLDSTLGGSGSTPGCWDGVFMEVSVNGAARTQLAITNFPYTYYIFSSNNPYLYKYAWCSPYFPSGWQKVSVDLSPYAGQSVQFFWTYAQDRSRNSGSTTPVTGLFLDDIKIVTGTRSAPQISCPELISAVNGRAPDLVNMNPITDVCIGVTATQSPAAGTVINPGSFVTLTATNAAGLTATCGSMIQGEAGSTTAAPTTAVATTGVATTGVATTGVATTGVATTGVATTGVATTRAATTGVATTGVATTRAATTGVATTRAATTGVATTRAATTGVATTRAATTGVATTRAATTAVATTRAATTGVATTRAATTGVATTGVATTRAATGCVGRGCSATTGVAAATTRAATTGVATTRAATTGVATTRAATTGVATTRAATTGVATTRAATTGVATTRAATTGVATTRAATTGVATTRAATTGVATTRAATTGVATTRAATTGVGGSGSATTGCIGRGCPRV